MNLLNQFRAYVAARWGGKTRQIDARRLNPSIAPDMDVDRVAGILRQAEAGDVRDLFALYRDILLAHSHLQGRFGERKEAVLGDALSVQPWDKKQSADAAVAVLVEREIARLGETWEQACNHLLDATLWPVALVEKVFAPALDGGGYQVAALVPVPHELIDYRAGKLQLREVSDDGRILDVVQDVDPRRYIVFRGHTLTTPDNWGGPMRCLVFWWLLGTMGRDWWARFLDKYGAPFPVGRYNDGDDTGRSVLEEAFALATRIGGLVVTRETEVELKQAAASDSGEAFARFHQLCNQEISKLILGQTLSSDAESTGLGSGVAANQEAVRQDRRQADARRLGAAMRSQLWEQWLGINGLPGQAPRLVWGTISTDEQKAVADVLTSLSQAQLTVTDDGLPGLSEKLGMPLQRLAAPAPLPLSPISAMSVRALSAGTPSVQRANDAVMRAAAVDLQTQLGRDFAPIRAIVLASEGPEDLLRRLEAHCAGFDPVKSAELIEAAMVALAANGAAAHAQ